jgi:hypothetical protein
MAASQTVVSAPRVSAIKALFNPTYYVAGTSALVLGVVFILLTGFVGSFGNTHLNAVLDVNIGQPAALWVFFAEGLINWLAVAVPLYVAGRLFSRSRNVRLVDVFGTQALARAPMLFAMLASLLPPFPRAAASLHTGAPRPTLASFTNNPDLVARMGVMIFVVLMIVWMVTLMYRAYTSSCNVKGPRAIASFIVALLVGELASKFAIVLLLGDVIRPV